MPEPAMLAATCAQEQILPAGWFVRFNRVERRGYAITHGPEQTVFAIHRPGVYRVRFRAQVSAPGCAAGCVLTVDGMPLPHTYTQADRACPAFPQTVWFETEVRIHTSAVLRVENRFPDTRYDDIWIEIAETRHHDWMT